MIKPNGAEKPPLFTQSLAGDCAKSLFEAFQMDDAQKNRELIEKVFRKIYQEDKDLYLRLIRQLGSTGKAFEKTAKQLQEKHPNFGKIIDHLYGLVDATRKIFIPQKAIEFGTAVVIDDVGQFNDDATKQLLRAIMLHVQDKCDSAPGAALKNPQSFGGYRGKGEREK